MVLSNKKLKQKLREAKAEALAASGTAANSAGTPNSEAQGTVKSLLAAASQKAKLAIKKKRKEKALSLQQNGENMDAIDEDKAVDIEDENKEVEKKKKKRKRDEEGKEVERGEVKEKKLKMNVKKLKMKEKNKKKKMKKKLKKEKVEKGGEEESVANGNEANGNHHIDEMNNTAINEASSNECMKVYVGGIPYYSTEDDIRSYFESCGTITEIDCMYFPETGKFRGIAIISFMTEAAAKRAIALDGSDMGGLFLKVEPYKSERSSKTSGFSPALVEGYNRIYAGNLSYDITEDDLKKLFSSCKIKSIRLGKDKETGEFRGYAHVDFSDSLSLSMALKLDQTVVHGRPIRISCAVPRKESVKKTQPIQQESVKKSQPIQQELVKKSQPIQGSAPPASREEYVANTQLALNTTPAYGAGLENVSGKIRRRTCYECGERGHLSSACPNKQASAQPIQEEPVNKLQPIKEEPFKKSQPIQDSAPPAPREEYVANSQLTLNTTPADGVGLENVSGKIRRRTCYECGERGHLSSACPKKQASDQPIHGESVNVSQPIKGEPFKKLQPIQDGAPPARTEEHVVNLQSSANATTPDDGAGVANVSGKIRRRTCYECGERGHLSSACSKKQASAQTNSVSS